MKKMLLIMGLMVSGFMYASEQGEPHPTSQKDVICYEPVGQPVIQLEGNNQEDMGERIDFEKRFAFIEPREVGQEVELRPTGPEPMSFCEKACFYSCGGICILYCCSPETCLIIRQKL